MLVTLYFKYGIGSKRGHSYLFSEPEYQRFRADFEAFLQGGRPKGGIYQCSAYDEDGQQQSIKELIVGFESLAFVDLTGQINSISLRTESAQQTGREAVN